MKNVGCWNGCKTHTGWETSWLRFTSTFFPFNLRFLSLFLYFIPFDLEMSCSFLIVFFMQDYMNVAQSSLMPSLVTTKLQGVLSLTPSCTFLNKTRFKLHHNCRFGNNCYSNVHLFQLSVCQTVSFSLPAFLSTCLYVCLSVYVLVWHCSTLMKTLTYFHSLEFFCR